MLGCHFLNVRSVCHQSPSIKKMATILGNETPTRLVRVVRVAAPGQYYECDVTGKNGHIMLLTPQEIEQYPNGKRKLQEFLTQSSVNIVKLQLWSPRSRDGNIEVQLDSGQHKIISRALVPGAAKCGPKLVNMERWNISQVKFRYRFQAGDYRADFYYVEWEAPNAPGEWIHKNQLYFQPSKGVKVWKKGTGSVPPPPLSPCGVMLATAEWDVFSTYYLQDIQRLIREGWRTTKSITGRVRQGAAFPCTPAVRDQLLLEAKHVTFMKGKCLNHYTFYSAVNLPDIFVGNKKKATADPWWFSTSSSELTPGNILHVLYAVIGDVTVHYNPKKHRMGISFDYTVLQSSTENIAWTRTHGCPLPSSWLFLNPVELKQLVLQKDQPYSKYFEAEDELDEPFDDAVSLAEDTEEVDNVIQ